MSSKIFKSNQISMGIPFQIRPLINFDSIKRVDYAEQKETEDINKHRAMEEQKIMNTSAEILERAREEAQMIVREAELEAAKIVDAALGEADMLKQSVMEEARVKGYEDAYEEAKRQYEDLIQEAEFIKEHATIEYNQVLAGMEADAMELVLEIVRKVIGAEVNLNKDSVMLLVKQAFDKCSNKDNVILKVSPDDYDYIMENKTKLLSMIEGIGDIEIKKEMSLKAGACIIDSAFGSIDAGIQTQLKKIEDMMMAMIGK